MQPQDAQDDPYFRYLDNLNKLGVANMRAAGIYLEGRFLLEPDEAVRVVDAWFAAFTEPPPS
jgi:hypothetical protein